MEIATRISETMNNSKYIYEDRTVRIPSKIRQKLDINLHTFLPFELIDNNISTLQVLTAYKDDVEKDTDAIYVTNKTFNRLKKETKTVLDKPLKTITLGCDPEVFLIRKDTGNIIAATDFFIKQGQVGNDGHLLEFRPLPTIDEYILTNNISNLIKEARRMINETIPYPANVGLHAASFYKGQAAGFHLHFGIPMNLMYPHIFKIAIIIKLIVRVLDYYVGILSILPEGSKDNGRRTSYLSDYGKPGVYRMGSAKVSYTKPTLEYRVPGASILRHPILTRGLIGLGAMVITDVISRIKTCTNNFKNLDILQYPKEMKEIYPHLPNKIEIFNLICSPTIYKAKSKLHSIYNDIEQMIDFDKHRAAIVDYFNLIDTAENISNDLEENWYGYTQ